MRSGKYQLEHVLTVFDGVQRTKRRYTLLVWFVPHVTNVETGASNLETMIFHDAEVIPRSKIIPHGSSRG